MPYGRNKGEVKIDSADALPARRHVSTFPSSAPTRATPCSSTRPDDTRGLLYFKAALEASGQSAFAIDPATPEQTANVSPAKYAFVVLSDVGALPAAFENELRAYVRGGGSVLIALGRNSVASAQCRWPTCAIEGTRYAGREGDLFPDRRLARFVAPLHSEGQPLGRREVLPGHPRRSRPARAWWRGSPTRRRC